MTLGSHQKCVGKSQVHLTPKWLIDRFPGFDLDPCAADPRPWDCAFNNYTVADDGLRKPWRGKIWLNPPFNRYEVGDWLAKLAGHNDGIALLHARTETEWFQPVWDHATAILFMANRIKFCRPDGSEQEANSGAPPVLVAYGEQCAGWLCRSGIGGALVEGWKQLRRAA